MRKRESMRLSGGLWPFESKELESSAWPWWPCPEETVREREEIKREKLSK
jgi:hypothetical protein